MRLDSSAYWATIRSVFFSPLPPIMIGMRPSGAGDVHGVADLVPLAVERGALAVEHADDDLEGLFQLLEAVGEGAELEAERLVLQLEPAGADAQLGAPPLDTTSSAVTILASSVGFR
jgi:hypothetical protein